MEGSQVRKSLCNFDYWGTISKRRRFNFFFFYQAKKDTRIIIVGFAYSLLWLMHDRLEDLIA